MPKKSRDHEAAIAIGSQMVFQIKTGIAIAISISDEDRDRDHDLDFGDRGHALEMNRTLIPKTSNQPDYSDMATQG